MPYVPGLEGVLPSIQEENVVTISLAAQATALPAGTAVTGGGTIASVSANTDFLGVTLQPVEISTTAKSVAVVYMDVAVGVAGAAIARGNVLTVTTNGQLIPAVAGQFIAGMALGTATAAGSPVQFLITRAGRQ
jgi:hypothetical protein